MPLLFDSWLTAAMAAAVEVAELGDGGAERAADAPELGDGGAERAADAPAPILATATLRAAGGSARAPGLITPTV